MMEGFRFRLTLTDALSVTDANAANTALILLVRPLVNPLEVTDLTLLDEAADGRLHIVRRSPLTG